MRLNYSKKVELNPNWFKLRLESRRLKPNGKPNIEYAYVSGFTAEQVKKDYSCLDYFVKVKPIEYDDIIRELESR